MLLTAQGISKRYFRRTGEANYFMAVRKTDFQLAPGTLTVLLGRSGSGKTTLLQMLSGLLAPTEGTVLADGTDLYALSDQPLSRFRNEHFGVIPQGNSALGNLTVMENLLLPGGIWGKASLPRDEAEALLERLGIAHLKDVYPGELSGGECRRMAIARALLRHPSVLFADEPTGDLDDENTDSVLHLLRETADLGSAVLLVTHETASEEVADVVFRMQSGCLEKKEVEAQPSDFRTNEAD